MNIKPTLASSVYQGEHTHPFRIVLHVNPHNPREIVVHHQNMPEGDLYHGHYFSSEYADDSESALDHYKRTCRKYGLNPLAGSLDVPQPKNAPDASGAPGKGIPRKTGEHEFADFGGAPRCVTCGADEDSAHVGGEPCSYVADDLHECDGCGRVLKREELKEVKDLLERVDEGGPMPSGECPDCGFLCYPKD